MSNKSSSKPPAAPPTGSRGRIDVSSVQSPLKQNPFAALAAQSLKQTASALADPPPTPEAKPPSPAPAAKPSPRGRLVLRREKGGRGGKTVVIISGFTQLPDRPSRAALETRMTDLEKHLKSRLGCGGSSDVTTGELLIQGDRPDAVADLLRELGYTVAGVTQKPAPSR